MAITFLGTTFSLAANNTAYTLGVAMTNFPGTGTYGITGAPGSAAVSMLGPYTNPNGAVNCCWSSLPAGTGTFTVTSLTATRMQGTLTGTLQPTPSTAATAPIDVNVTFDIGLPSP